MTESEIQQACAAQGAAIVADLEQAGAAVTPDREIVALISYLQKLGKAEKVSVPAAAAHTAAN
jgi:cbb3-type cytochrome oxidase cytochrome c subunit